MDNVRPKTIENSVTINADRGMYVIDHGGHVSCWGFDNVLDRIKRMAIELAGRGKLPPEYIEVDDISVLTEGEAAAVRQLLPPRGSRTAYDMHQNLMDLLQEVCVEQDDRAVFDLTPQLEGLEGCRVEVETTYGEKRRFIVGKSTGWFPCHLEVARRNSSGGPAAEREYKSVTVIERDVR